MSAWRGMSRTDYQAYTDGPSVDIEGYGQGEQEEFGDAYSKANRTDNFEEGFEYREYEVEVDSNGLLTVDEYFAEMHA